jgi:hypothetical protein
MDVIYSSEVREWDGFKLLEQASILLAEVLGPQSAALVKAEWNRVQDPNGRMVYRLTIRDFTGEVSTDFTLDELQNPLHMRFRLPRLWGDLLQVRNNQQHQQVQVLSDQMIVAG